MSIKDILLHIDSYPDATSMAAIDQAVGFAATAGATLSAIAVQVRFRTPSNPLADYLIHLGELAGQEEARSAAASRDALDHFAAAAAARGVLGQAVREQADLDFVVDHVVRQARLHDLALVPLGGPLDGQREVAEALIFESGAPVLVYRAGEADLPADRIGVVALAWDGSRAAARTLSAALPLLALARQVRVLTVVNDKPSARPGMGEGVLRRLAAHGVTAVLDEVDAAGQPAGVVIEAFAANHAADMIVMGAYGRSRVREFILGGATEHMLHRPRVPLLLAH